MANLWVTLTETHVLSALNRIELTAYRESKSTDEPDPLADILADVTSDVRSACFGALAELPATGIPPSLKRTALAIVVWELAKRLHTSTDAQRWPAAEKAFKRLEQVASGDRGIEDSSNLAVNAGLGGSEVVKKVTRVVTSDTMSGL